MKCLLISAIVMTFSLASFAQSNPACERLELAKKEEIEKLESYFGHLTGKEDFCFQDALDNCERSSTGREYRLAELSYEKCMDKLTEKNDVALEEIELVFENELFQDEKFYLHYRNVFYDYALGDRGQIRTTITASRNGSQYDLWGTNLIESGDHFTFLLFEDVAGPDYDLPLFGHRGGRNSIIVLEGKAKRWFKLAKDNKVKRFEVNIDDTTYLMPY